MVVEIANNTKRPSYIANVAPVKRNIVGQGVGSLDDFENVYKVIVS